MGVHVLALFGVASVHLIHCNFITTQARLLQCNLVQELCQPLRSTQAPQQLKDLRPSVATNIILSFIALQNGPLSRFDETGPLVSAALEADATAPVHLHLIGEKTGHL